MKTLTTKELQVIADGIRSFSMLANRHPGGSLSSVEIMTTLFYSGVTNLDYAASERDYFVQSKGHAASPLIFTMWAQGLIEQPLEKVLRYGEHGADLPRMPQRNAQLGVELGTGSLGQGLSFGLGLAIASRKQGSRRRAYVLLGDGETTEGQVWEAAMTAARLRMRNVTVLLDANGSGSLIKLDRSEWKNRWEGFGWHTQVVNGHDIAAIQKALSATAQADRPSVIICETIKGKGLGTPLEGSNQLSSDIPAESIPASATKESIEKARDIIRTHFKQITHVTRSDEKTGETFAQIGHRLTSSAIGKTEVTKKVGGSIAADLADLPLLFMATDAIRNSGLMEQMDKYGPWDWDNPKSSILQLAIAEQDAISLCAGVTAAGVTGLYFSMEGFYWRGLDQIRQSVLFPQIPAVLVGTSGGVGDLLGPMVQSDRLMPVLQQMIGLDILEAADSNQARAFFAHALSAGQPAYIRLPHDAMPVLADVPTYLSRSIKDGYYVHVDAKKPDVVFVTAGAMLPVVLRAAETLAASGKHCRVIEVFGVSRFSALAAHKKAALLPKDVLQISAHNAPSTVLGQFLQGSMVRTIGVDDWGKAGEDLQELYEDYGLTAESIARLAQEK